MFCWTAVWWWKLCTRRYAPRVVWSRGLAGYSIEIQGGPTRAARVIRMLSIWPPTRWTGEGGEFGGGRGEEAPATQVFSRSLPTPYSLLHHLRCRPSPEGWSP